MNESRLPVETPVAIVGAGPVGLALALALARQRVRSVLIERNDGTSGTSRAPGIHVRTLEALRQWGVEDRFRAEGTLLQPVRIHAIEDGRPPLLSLDFSSLEEEADRPGLLILEQSRTERLLLDAVQASGFCRVLFDAEAFALEQNVDHARLHVRRADGELVVSARYVVGCDGAGSFVRDALELPFEGLTYSLRPMLADVVIDDARDALPYPRTWRGSGDGLAFAVRLRPGLWRLVHIAQGDPERDDVPDAEVQQHVDRLLGPGPARVLWSSRFRIHVRSAPRFRVGRVLLAGDAAHVHSPVSGFGMNGGILDAHNLAWKLATALRGGDVERLLDSYDVERRTVVVEDTSQYTDRVTRLFLQAPAFVRDATLLLTRTLLRLSRVRERALRRLTMIDLDYPASPLLDARERAAGVRLPNVWLRSRGSGGTRLYDLLPAGAPLLLDVATAPRTARLDLPLPDVIEIGEHAHDDVSGRLRALLDGRDGWILVRPDAHIAWARHDPRGMNDAAQRALGHTRAV